MEIELQTVCLQGSSGQLDNCMLLLRLAGSKNQQGTACTKASLVHPGKFPQGKPWECLFHLDNNDQSSNEA